MRALLVMMAVTCCHFARAENLTELLKDKLLKILGDTRNSTKTQIQLQRDDVTGAALEYSYYTMQ